MTRHLPSLTLLLAVAAAIACSNPAAPKKAPARDPAALIYVVDDFNFPAPPLMGVSPNHGMNLRFIITDNGGPGDVGTDTTFNTVDTLHRVICQGVGDTLGQRTVAVEAVADSGSDTLSINGPVAAPTLATYRLPAFDPSAGVDTTGGVGETEDHPWIWRWRVGDSTVTGFPRPASWPSGYCVF